MNQIKILLKVTAFLMIILVALFCSSNEEKSNNLNENEKEIKEDSELEKISCELSYWIDMDLFGTHLRGYWYNVSSQDPIDLTPSHYIQNACQKLRNDYGATKLYVIYHRQYEIPIAKTVFKIWKQHANANNLEVVPTVVLQDYSPTQNMNFTDEEIKSFARWCVEEIHPKEFGIYDVYTRDRKGQPQAIQISGLRHFIGNKLVMVGMQPGVAINDDFLFAVQDTWTAECQGRTNELWENPVFYNGTNIYGRKLLETWVIERRDEYAGKIVWNLIPVAWDYDTADPLSYICPGDNQYKNDPPIPGRLLLCHKYFVSWYDQGLKNEKFGGYSCDLHILQANSGGRGETPSFYKALRDKINYSGDFADTMLEIGSLYKELRLDIEK